MKDKILSLINSTAAGVAGAAIFLLIAFALHIGGIGKEAASTSQPAQTAASALQEFTQAPAPSGANMTPQQIFQKYGDSAVEIDSTFQSQSGQGDIFNMGQQPAEQGIGSGFVVSKDGYILTNAHVIANTGSGQGGLGQGGLGGPAEKASKVQVKFKNGKTAQAQVVGYDLTSSDVAVLKVDPAGLNLVPSVLGDSNDVQVGEPVVAIGSPFGVYSSSLTAGVVSAVNRTVESPQQGFTINNAIQTDAAINRGNSGGPLFNSRGEVIGLSEQIATTSGGSEGVGFAVPINIAKQVEAQVIKTGHVQYAFMGVVGQTVDKGLAQTQGLSVAHGALLTEVQSGSPAEKAGLKQGDIITAIDGHAMSSMDDITAYLVQKKPGDKIKVTYTRSKDSRDADLTLGQRPTN